MSKKLLSVTVDEEIIEQLKANSNKGKLSEYTEEILRAGLPKSEQAKDLMHDLLVIAKKLNEHRKNGTIVFTEEQ